MLLISPLVCGDINRFIDIFMELEQISQIEISCDRLICYPDFFGEISTSKKSIAKEVILRIHAEKVDRLKSQGVEIIYTDGSVSNIGTNYAFFIPRLGHKQSFHSDKILFSTSAELLVISEAIVFAMEYNLSDIAILSDSKAGLLSVMNDSYDNYLVGKIRCLVR